MIFAETAETQDRLEYVGKEGNKVEGAGPEISGASGSGDDAERRHMECFDEVGTNFLANVGVNELSGRIRPAPAV